MSQQQPTKVTCPACFGTEPDCDSCDGRGYFLQHAPPTPEAEAEAEAKVSVSPAIEEATAELKATARPWKVNGTYIMASSHEDVVITQCYGRNHQFSLPEFENKANAALIVTAVNAFDSHKAEIERLNSLHDTLCSVLCRETQTETPIAAITAIRSNAAKVEKLEATLRWALNAEMLYCDCYVSEDVDEDTCTGKCVYAAAAALVESPETKENN